MLATSDIYLDFIRPTALRVSRARAIPETDDYVGSTVVMLRG